MAEVISQVSRGGDVPRRPSHAAQIKAGEEAASELEQIRQELAMAKGKSVGQVSQSVRSELEQIRQELAMAKGKLTESKC